MLLTKFDTLIDLHTKNIFMASFWWSKTSRLASSSLLILSRVPTLLCHTICLSTTDKQTLFAYPANSHCETPHSIIRERVTQVTLTFYLWIICLNLRYYRITKDYVLNNIMSSNVKTDTLLYLRHCDWFCYQNKGSKL
jgi:hypothetical protein